MNTHKKKQTAIPLGIVQRLLASPYVHAILILIVVLAAYQYIFQIYFLSDDFNLLAGSSRWMTSVEEFFRPLPHLLIHIFYQCFGLHLLPYHLLSLFLHYFSALLVYLLLRKLIVNKFFALAGGVLFASLFLISEAVFWISAVTTLLVTVFYLLGLYLYLEYLGKSKKSYLILALLSLVMALLSKENAVTFPVMVISFDLCCGKEKAFKEKIVAAIKRTWPFFLVTAIYLVFKANSIASAVTANALSLGYHNLRNWRHLLLSLVTLNPFYDLPFLFIDITVLNLFLTNEIARPVIPLDIKTITSFLAGTVIILGCVYLLFKGNRLVKTTLIAFTIATVPFIFMTSHHLPFAGYYLYPLRLYYLPAAFFFIFIILLLHRVALRLRTNERFAKLIVPVMILLTLSITFSEILKVRQKSADWIFASTIAQSVIKQLGDFLPASSDTTGDQENSIVLFHLPDSYKGAYIFRNGIQSAAKIYYPGAGVRLLVSRKNPEDIRHRETPKAKEKITWIDCSEAKLKLFVPGSQ